MEDLTENKIHVHPIIEDDKYFKSNAITGKITTGYMFPLIFLEPLPDTDNNYYRSWEFMENQYKKGYEDFDGLTFEQKVLFKIGMRDLWIASHNQMLSVEKIEQFKKWIELFKGESGDSGWILENLNVQFYPNGNYCMARWVPIKDDIAIKEGLVEYFIQHNGNCLVFVNPMALSYHNFECIIPLNNWIKKKTHNSEWFLEEIKELHQGVIEAKLNPYCMDFLNEIDELDLYLPPTNGSQRGGKRLLFSSKDLAKGLENTLRKAGEKNLVLEKYLQNLVYLNWVFRYNRFETDDDKFSSHLDIPYTDKQNNHYSKMTMLIYLTDGDNPDGVLDLMGIHKWKKIKKFQVIIFDQSIEHEARSYIDSSKILLRTDLIYHVDPKELGHDQKLSNIFNSACYFSMQGLKNETIVEQTNKLFDYVTKCRYRYNDDIKIEIPLIMKYMEYYRAEYITDGNDFYFAPDSDPKQCALIVIYDLFKQPFIEIINDNIKKDDLDNYLSELTTIIVDNYDSEGFLKKPKPIEYLSDNDDYCCFYHSGFEEEDAIKFNEMLKNPNSNYNVLSNYSVAIRISQRVIDSDEEVDYLEDNFVVNLKDMEDNNVDTIRFKNTGFRQKVNFAASFMGSCEDDLNRIFLTDEEFKLYSLPDIKYIRNEKYLKMIVNFFDNGVYFKKKTNTVGVVFYNDQNSLYEQENSNLIYSDSDSD